MGVFILVLFLIINLTGDWFFALNISVILLCIYAMYVGSKIKK